MVAGIAAGLLYWADPAWRTEHHATGAGERRDVALADGSTLSLDAATALDMVWRLRSRRVALVQGQARFAVVPSSWRPFQVAAASARIRVVGTVFDVRRQGDRVQVTVLQGRVEVRNQGDASGPLALLPGQRLRMEEGRPTAVPQSVDLAQAGAWRQGRLVFDRTPLREALADVQRHRSAPIRLHDDGRLGRHAISGVFEAERTDQMLDLLPRIVPAQVQRRADGSVDIAPAAR
jgi:transmembrane sensor